MPKIVDPEVKRAEFVAASLTVIAAEGLSGATLKRVAAQAGCTTGALTHYFADRGELLVDALRGAHYAAGLRMVTAASLATSDVERLNVVLLEALPLDELRLSEWKVWLAFWSATSGDPVLAAENSRRYDEWRELLETVLTPLARDMEEMRAEAALLIGLVDGLGLRIALFRGSPEDLKAAQTEAVETLERYTTRFQGRPR
jgi:AcrR family transcriptional regulator